MAREEVAQPADATNRLVVRVSFCVSLSDCELVGNVIDL